MNTIIDWTRNANVWGRFFAGPTWAAQRAFLATLFRLPMTPEEEAIYRECTGRTRLPTNPFREAWLIAGRRSGKSRLGAMLLVYQATSVNWRKRLAPGEIGIAMCLARDQGQAAVVFKYAEALINETPMLKQMVVSSTRQSITLDNGAAIEVHANDFRGVRGRTLIAVVLDEVGFWDANIESDNPDVEVVRAVNPALVTTGGLLIGLSTPHAKSGVLWQRYQKHHGVDDAPVLTFQAPTARMNPTIASETVAEALLEDEGAARAEWLAEFRSDLESYVSLETLRACVVPDREELAPLADAKHYAFCDPSSGGARVHGDSFALAIARRSKPDGTAVLCKLVEVRPPFDPKDAIAALVPVLRAYGCRSVTGDSYGKGYVASDFREHGITYIESERTASELFLELLGLLNSRRVELLDHQPKLLTQFVNLEYRRGRLGKDSVSHPARLGAHDDCAAAVAGALLLVPRRPSVPMARSSSPTLKEIILNVAKW